MKKKKVSIVISILCLLFTSSLPVQADSNSDKSASIQSIQTVITKGNWNEFSSPTTLDLYSIAMTSAANGWAVGENGIILHWDGIKWSQEVSPTSAEDTLVSISADSATDAWAVGIYGALKHWDGKAWSDFSPKPDYIYPNTISAVDPTHVWITEGYALCNTHSLVCNDYGYIYHWNGSSWSSSGNISLELTSIFMLDNNDGWITGINHYGNYDGKYTIEQWNGSSWKSEIQPEDRAFTSISALSTKDAWAVGSTIAHWDGTQWVNKVGNSFLDNLTAVDMVSTSDVWTVGKTGAILHWDGYGWSDANRATNDDLYGLKMVSADEGWAVGASGTILHYGIPTVTINYSYGKPGSYFIVHGKNFPPNAETETKINQIPIVTPNTSSSGEITFSLNTDSAGDGMYTLSIKARTTATTCFRLEEDAPLRTAQEPTVYNVPAGIGYNNFSNLPVVIK